MQSSGLLIIAALGALGLAVGLPVAIWSMPDDLETAARVVSNRAAKQDRLDAGHSRAMAAAPGARPALVRQIRVLDSGETVVMLVDASGRIVYRSDPSLRETLVARNAPAARLLGDPGPDFMLAGLAHRDPPEDPDRFVRRLLEGRT